MSCNEGDQLTIVARRLAGEVWMRVRGRDGREIDRRRGPAAVLVTLAVVVVPGSRWTQVMVVVLATVQGCHCALQGVICCADAVTVSSLAAARRR